MCCWLQIMLTRLQQFGSRMPIAERIGHKAEQESVRSGHVRMDTNVDSILHVYMYTMILILLFAYSDFSHVYFSHARAIADITGLSLVYPPWHFTVANSVLCNITLYLYISGHPCRVAIYTIVIFYYYTRSHFWEWLLPALLTGRQPSGISRSLGSRELIHPHPPEESGWSTKAKLAKNLCNDLRRLLRLLPIH